MRVKIGKYPTHRFYHNWLYNWFGYSQQQRTSIKIHKYDTWSMDDTLAPIILPMLVQLKATTHGAPMVDLEDVPKLLHPTKKQQAEYNKTGSTDPKFFTRWDWILDEMIWAFEMLTKDDWESDYYGDWIKDESSLSGHFDWTDDEGRKKANVRIDNGLRLFGKYFRCLWD